MFGYELSMIEKTDSFSFLGKNRDIFYLVIYNKLNITIQSTTDNEEDDEVQEIKYKFKQKPSKEQLGEQIQKLITINNI